MCVVSLAHTKVKLAQLVASELPLGSVDVVVNNRSRCSITRSVPEMSAILDRRILAAVAPAPELCVRANREGVPIALLQPEEVTVQAMAEVGRSILQ
jgi:hypothetical protein